MEARTAVLARRRNAVSDLSAVTHETGSIVWNDSEFVSSLARNNIYNIGLGTETEQGLQPARYPIRVVLENGSKNKADPQTVIRGWCVLAADLKPQVFSRAPDYTEEAVLNLLKFVDNFDATFDEMVDESKSNTKKVVDDVIQDNEDLHTLLSNPVLDQGQVVSFKAIMTSIRNKCIAAGAVPYFKIGANAVLFARRHACSYNVTTSADLNGILATEFALTYKVNVSELQRRNVSVPSGLANFCAYGIAWYFRQGLYECYESKEFHTIVCKQSAEGVYQISSSTFPDEYPAPAHLTVGSTISIGAIRYEPIMVKIAPAGAYCAGVNHYSFNHTTSGSVLGGAMLTLLRTHNLYNASGGAELEQAQTAMIYEAFHPVNKRAIANLFFKKSRVTSYGKAAGTPSIQTLELDAFLTVRENPSPAGAHKAYICGAVLAMVCRQGIAPFLSFASTLEFVISQIEKIIEQGAASHVGASYYTGRHSMTQGSVLDEYLPDLAQYMQTMASKHTLCYSPHMSKEVAASCSAHFHSVLKQMKGKDLGAVSEEAIARFLAHTGKQAFSFDMDDVATWPKAIGDGVKASERLVAILNS